MNGPHDLGGQMGFGPVAPEKDEPYFHAEWEKRALGITLSCGAFGAWSIDESRHARENIPPASYLAASYYEVWIRGVDMLLERHGFATAEELAQGRHLEQGRAPKRVLKADMVEGVLARGGPCDRPVETVPKFAVGDRVRTRNFHPAGHTRLPRYARRRRVSWRPCRAASSIQTTTPMAEARTRNGSIRSCSRETRSGARGRIRL